MFQCLKKVQVENPLFLIDEIDKAFSNTSSTGDSGTSNRVLATFISCWTFRLTIFSPGMAKLRFCPSTIWRKATPTTFPCISITGLPLEPLEIGAVIWKTSPLPEISRIAEMIPSLTVDLRSVSDIHWATTCIALYLGITHAFLDSWTSTVLDAIAIFVRLTMGAIYTEVCNIKEGHYNFVK